ncbi:fasciclin [Nostocales cyanobacterium HT-58-2]|nr:fasciclin [Nostocales cyanobacterium HT-58-2]
MQIGNLTQLTTKLALVTGIVGASAFFGVGAIAQSASPFESIAQTTTETQSPAATPTSPAPANTTGAATGNIVEVASASGSFNTLTQAVEAAGLANTLSSGSYTIFAPTDQAFSNSLPAGAVEFLLKPENKNLLRQVLSYHVVPGEVTSKELTNGSVKTLSGAVAIRVTPERVVVNDASVVQPNIQAKNGVIHAVNRVLLPEQLRQTIASKLATQQQSQAPQ